MAEVSIPEAGALVSVSEADASIRTAVAPSPVESVPLSEAAGRVLREAILADRDFPPFDRVTMDGVALSSAAYREGARRFRVAGIQAAGTAPRELPDRSCCFEVMTGAVLPVGCDCVIPVEELRMEGDTVCVENARSVRPYHHVHSCGSDHAAGARLVQAGKRLTPAAVAVAASVGKSVLEVSCLPSIGVVATGDELAPVEAVVEPHQIRRSNTHAIAADIRLRMLGVVAEYHFPDNLEVICERLDALLERHDILVLSGGVSKGKYDHIPEALAAVGVACVFHRVTQRPGRPMWFGKTSAGKAVFALPGNPVSTLVCHRRYVAPFLERVAGETPCAPERVALGEAVTFKPDLTYYLPVRVETSERGVLTAYPRETNTSGDFAGLLGTDGFVELARERSEFPAGSVVPLHRWRG